MSIVAPAYEVLRDRLREDIIAGVIVPGSRLTIGEVSTRFGTSHMPVREAFQWLQGEGLVRILPHKGVRVLDVDVRFVANIFDIRSAIEELLACRSAGAMDTASLAHARALNDRIRACAESGELQYNFDLDRDFHATIYARADNAEALEIFSKYSNIILALRRRYGFGPGRVEETVREHDRLLEAVADGDSDAAARIAKDHKTVAKEDLIALMTQGGDCEPPAGNSPSRREG